MLLRTSYREEGEVKLRILGNLSGCSPEEIDAIRAALRYKGQIGPLLTQIQEAASQGLATDGGGRLRLAPVP